MVHKLLRILLVLVFFLTSTETSLLATGTHLAPKSRLGSLGDFRETSSSIIEKSRALRAPGVPHKSTIKSFALSADNNLLLLNLIDDKVVIYKRSYGDRFSRVDVKGLTSNSLEYSNIKLSRNWLRPFYHLPVWARVLVSASTILAIVLGSFYYFAQLRLAEWKQSKSGQNIVAIYDAYENGDAYFLDEMGEEARARHLRMMERIRIAESEGLEEVDDDTKDPLGKARRYAAFDLFVSAMADMTENEVSDNTEKRIGLQLPAYWDEDLKSQERRAIENESESQLFHSLVKLLNELKTQNERADSLKSEIDGFNKHVPYLFGGEMAELIDDAEKFLETFRNSEIGAEDSLYQQLNKNMRNRVDKKLYDADPEHKRHRDSRDDLNKLYESKVTPVVKLAISIDDDISDMISSRHTQAAMNVLAEANKAVPVTKYRTKYRTAYRTVNGKRESYQQSYQESYVVIEDHSGPYRAAAAVAAASAQSSAQSANRGLQELKKKLPELGLDPTFKKEGLGKLLPSDLQKNLDEGPSFVWDLFLPPVWNMFMGMSSASDGQSAQRNFAPILTSVKNIQAIVSNRHKTEASWVEVNITDDLFEQAELEDDLYARANVFSKVLKTKIERPGVKAISLISDKSDFVKVVFDNGKEKVLKISDLPEDAFEVKNALKEQLPSLYQQHFDSAA